MKKFLSFKKAREYVRELGLKKMSEWEIWRKQRPPFIPCSPHQVYKEQWVSYMDWMGYKKISYDRKRYSINDNFFEVWTHDMSYILGFWYADGCIYDSLFTITQSNSEKYLLGGIAKTMGYDGPLKDIRGKYCNLTIYCRNLVESIKKVGGTERKSLTCRFPYVPKEFLPDFIRGYFDGDGCISILKNNSAESSFTIGSKKFAESIALILSKDIPDFNFRVESLKSKYFRVRTSTNGSRKLRDYMYSTPSKLFMKRKKKKLYSLGDVKMLKSGFMPYDDAKCFVCSLGIRSKTEWELYWKDNKKPIDLPSSPNRTYKNSGWVNWKNWLGYEKERVKGEEL